MSVQTLFQRWTSWRDRSAPTEPGAALFNRLRMRLTLWYGGVFAVALMVCGSVLYFGLQDLTLSPISESMRSMVEFQAREWVRTPAHICGQPGGRPSPPPNRLPSPIPIYIACFDLQGNVLNTQLMAPGRPSGTLPEAFLQSPPIADAVRSGVTDDVIEGGEEIGPVFRMAMAVKDPSTGSPVGVVQVGRSIAAQMETLQNLRALLALLAAMALLGAVAGGLFLGDRALDPARWAFARQQAFIADASHQLRTPLTLLRADAELLLRHRERLDPDDAELMDDILAETIHMDHLASDLLTLARLDAGRAHLEHDIIDLSELAAELARRVSSLAKEKRLTINEEYEDGAVLVGDRHSVEQAALILIDNAIKYTPAGGTITLKTIAADDQASLVVEDTGAGIPPEHLHRLGERFYRVDPSRNTQGGSGLGLAIARGIAAAHGGTVRLTSAQPHGARATLTLATSGPTR
jgi:signal transduction histidine kinase